MLTLGGKEFKNIDLIKSETKRIISKYKDGEKLENEDKDFFWIYLNIIIIIKKK